MKNGIAGLVRCSASRWSPPWGFGPLMVMGPGANAVHALAGLAMQITRGALPVRTGSSGTRPAQCRGAGTRPGLGGALWLLPGGHRVARHSNGRGAAVMLSQARE